MPKTQKTTKILVSLWKVLYDGLAKRVEASCMRRDAFLAAVIATEIVHLEKEIQKPNSAEAKACISDYLKRLPRRPLTIKLATETAEKLDEICEKKNIVRDAFINRLVLCLLAPRDLINVIYSTEECLSEVVSQYGRPGEEHHWQALRLIPELVSNPFWFVRACLEVGNETSGLEPTTFYAAHIPDGLFGDPEKILDAGKSRAPNTLGFNVYLPDELIPGHPAEQAARDLLDLQLEQLRKA